MIEGETQFAERFAAVVARRGVWRNSQLQPVQSGGFLAVEGFEAGGYKPWLGGDGRHIEFGVAVLHADGEHAFECCSRLEDAEIERAAKVDAFAEHGDATQHATA